MEPIPREFFLAAFEDHAWFLPSISSQFTHTVSRDLASLRKGRTHIKLQSTSQLNFLDEDALFYYPKALYSAGHAELDPKKSAIKERIIQKRDPETFIMTDSGGFQIITGQLKGFWNANGSASDSKRLALFKWMERTADVMVTLDIPLRALSEKNVEKFKEKSGGIPPPYKNYDDCLRLTIKNLKFFAKQKRTKPIINALHGRDIDEARRWYEEVKFFDGNGWAFAGDLAADLFLTLSLLVHMWKDGAFEGEKGLWLHFLGFGTSQSGCVFSHLHRVLRDVVNPDLQVTYDNANAFSESGRGIVYLYHSPEQLGAKPTSIEREHFDDTLRYHNPEKPYPDAWSPVMREIPVGDIRTIKPKGDSNLDGLGYAILQAHNAFVHVKAITDANYLMQHEMVRIAKYMQANQTPGSDKKLSIPLNEIGWVADYCGEIIRVSTIIEKVFSSDDPFSVLSEHEDRLRAFHSAR